MRLPEDQLKDAMKTLGLTTEELAEKCGVRPETVYHWARGKKRVPGRMASLITALLTQAERRDVLAASTGK
jgi:transcriptional regulator with XRE-family HTH domain